MLYEKALTRSTSNLIYISNLVLGVMGVSMGYREWDTVWKCTGRVVGVWLGTRHRGPGVSRIIIYSEGHSGI